MHAYYYSHCDSVISHPCGGHLGAGHCQETMSSYIKLPNDLNTNVLGFGHRISELYMEIQITICKLVMRI